MATTDARGVKITRVKIKVKVRNAKKRGLPSAADKAILKLGQSPVSEQTTSLKLMDDLSNEVKRKLDNWRDRDDECILINMLVRLIEICNNYSFYTAEGKWQVVVQSVSRALSGKCQREFNKLLQEVDNKHKTLVQKLYEKIFKKKAYEDQKYAMR